MPYYIAIFNDPRIILALVIVALLFVFGVGWRLMITLIALWITAVITVIFSFDISVDTLFQGRKPPEIETDKWVAAHTILFVWELLLVAFAIVCLKMKRTPLPQ